MPNTSWYRIENAAGREADVFIMDEISPYGVTAQDFVRALNGVTAQTINLHLNTPGGDVFDGIAIFNALKNHPATINAFIPGLAASIGTVIAMAADRIVIAPHARMMIHEAWGGAMGNAADMAKMAQRLEATSENIASIYAERAGGDVSAWRDLMREESWYTDQQAVDAGLADEVGLPNQEAGRQAALFDLSRFRKGEQEAARLREDFGIKSEYDPTPLTAEQVHEQMAAFLEQHASVCVDEACPYTPASPRDERESTETNEFIREREELEAALATVNVKGGHSWL